MMHIREIKLLSIIIMAIITLYLIITSIFSVNKYNPHSPYEPEVWISRYKYNSSELYDVEFNIHKRGRLYFEISLNGIKSKAYFDTGNAFNICITEQLASKSNFHIDNYANVYSSEGTLISKSPQFKVNSFYIGNEKMYIDSGIIVEGKESFFGFEPFKSGRITLDYKNKKVAFSELSLPENIISNENRQVFNFITAEGRGEGYIIIPIEINDKEYYAMVDTGAGVSVVDSQIASKLNARQNIFGRIKVQNLEIGNFKISLPSVSVHSQQSVSRGIEKKIMATIGADVLCQYLVTIDYQQRLLILER